MKACLVSNSIPPTKAYSELEEWETSVEVAELEIALIGAMTACMTRIEASSASLRMAGSNTISILITKLMTLASTHLMMSLIANLRRHKREKNPCLRNLRKPRARRERKRRKRKRS